jgi:dynein intermediate chain 1
LFVVGTEEGAVHKCSKAYTGAYLETYAGHHMAVYTLVWNPFHPRVFLSCSADWTVKLWDRDLKVPPLGGVGRGRGTAQCATRDTTVCPPTPFTLHASRHTLGSNHLPLRRSLSHSLIAAAYLSALTLKVPIMSFDLGNAVGDVAWSPYSSTVFAAVTADGKVHVFDLNENKHEPLCEQKVRKQEARLGRPSRLTFVSVLACLQVVKRAKLTHVKFNPDAPMLVVGDDRGGVISLKLSPNLRQVGEPYDVEGNPLPHDPIQLQVDKMDRLLASIDVDKPQA